MERAVEGAPNLNVSLSAESNSNPLGSSVEELEIVTVKANITNNGTSEVKDVNLLVNLTKNAKFVSGNGTQTVRQRVVTKEDGKQEIINVDYISVPVRKYFTRKNKRNNI